MSKSEISALLDAVLAFLKGNPDCERVVELSYEPDNPPRLADLHKDRATV
jgi:hypothetical protein